MKRFFGGLGKTDVGPNNCMPMEWPENLRSRFSRAPSRWANERWGLVD